MHPKKILAVAAGAIIVLLIVAVFLPSGEQASLAPITLPDGTAVRIQKVTFGTQHRLLSGSAVGHVWQQLAPYLPAAWRNKLALHTPREFGTYGTINASLAVWLYRTAAPSNRFSEDTLLEVTDETGVVHLPKGSPSYHWLGTNVSCERMEMHLFEAFPRQGKTLTFHVYSVGVVNNNRQFVRAGTFQVRNPAQGPFAAWQAEPLPARRIHGDLEFSLLQLTTKTNAASRIPPLTATNKAGTEAVFQITRQGVPALDWQVESLRLRDSTDNALYLWSGAGGVSSNGFFFVPRFWLAPEEPWKVWAEFVHKSGFAPEEVGTLENVPVNFNVQWPAVSTNRILTVKGKQLCLQNLQWEPNWGGNAALEVMVTPKTRDFRIRLLKVTDQRGSELAIIRPPPGYGDFRSGTHFFGLTIPGDASSLNLTFAYEECRFAEFTAKAAAENGEGNAP